MYLLRHSSETGVVRSATSPRWHYTHEGDPVLGLRIRQKSYSFFALYTSQPTVVLPTGLLRLSIRVSHRRKENRITGYLVLRKSLSFLYSYDHISEVPRMLYARFCPPTDLGVGDGNFKT